MTSIGLPMRSGSWSHWADSRKWSWPRARIATRGSAPSVVDLLDDPKSLGSISRHAQDGATRLRALARLKDADEIANVAVKSEHTDVAVSALDRVDGAEALSAIAQRARNKVAARRARMKLRQLEEASQPPHDVAVPMSAEDRQRALDLLHRAEALVTTADPDEATTALAEVRLAWAELQADVEIDAAARAPVRRGERGRA